MSYLFVDHTIPAMPRITHFGFRDLRTIAEAPPHRHFGYEFVYCVDHHTQVLLSPGDTRQTLRHDDLLIVPPGARHCFAGSEQGITYYWIGLQTSRQYALASVSQWPCEHWDHGPDNPPPATYLADGEDAQLAVLDRVVPSNRMIILHQLSAVLPTFVRLRDEICRPRDLSRSYLFALVSQLVITIAREVEQYTPRDPHDRIDTVATYLEANLYRPIGLDDLCALTGLSRSYLCRSFRTRFGVSPLRYLRDLRVQEAKRLLCRGQDLQSVALSCGFSSAAHLCAAFGEAVGRTPGSYAHTARWTSIGAGSVPRRAAITPPGSARPA